MADRRWKQWLPCAALAALGFAHAVPALLTGRTFASNDYGAELIPAFAALRGHVPFLGAPGWNASIFAGAPAEVLPGMARYPLNVFAYLLPAEMAVPLFVGIHLALAAVTAWFFVRRVGGASPGASMVGAMIYAFSGALWLRGMHGQNLAVAAWLPAMLLGVREVCAAESPGWRMRWAAALGGMAGMALLTGGGVPVLMMGALAAPFVAKDGLAHRKEGGVRFLGAAKEAAPALAAALGIALLISLPAVIPMWETIRGAARGGLSIGQTGTFSLTPPSFARLLDPGWLLGPGSFEGRWEWPDYVEKWIYFGLLPLPLVAIGVRGPRGSGLALALLATLVLALGLYGPLHWIAYFVVPGYDHLRAHGRWVILAGLLVGTLAARGIDAIQAQQVPRNRLIALTAIMAGVAAWAFASGRILPGTHATLAAVWLLGASRLGAHTGKDRLVSLGAAALLAADFAGSVVLANPLLADPSVLAAPAGFEAAAQAATLNQRITHGMYGIGPLPLNNGARWGYRNARGYSQLVPESFSRLLDLGAPPVTRFTGDPERVDPALLQFLGVGTYVSDDQTEPPQGIVERPIFREGGIAVFRTERDPFLAGVAGELRIAADQRSEIAHSLGSDLNRVVVLPKGTVPPKLPGAGAPGEVVSMERLSSGRVRLRVKAAAPSMVVLGESWHPRWRAIVDGKAAELLRVDVLWMGVPVSAGEHEVVFACRTGARWWTWIGFLSGVLGTWAGLRRKTGGISA